MKIVKISRIAGGEFFFEYLPYFDCKIVVIQGKIGFIKVILIEKIDDFSSPQARKF